MQTHEQMKEMWGKEEEERDMAYGSRVLNKLGNIAPASCVGCHNTSRVCDAFPEKYVIFYSLKVSLKRFELKINVLN